MKSQKFHSQIAEIINSKFWRKYKYTFSLIIDLYSGTLTGFSTFDFITLFSVASGLAL